MDESHLIQSGPPPDAGRSLLSLVRPADFAHHDEVLDTLVARLRVGRMITEGEVELATHCLHEALANAIVHGARGRGELRVELCVIEGGWTLAIDDGGQGFPASALPGDSQALGARGRGIRIMRAFVDDLRWFRGGSCAVLTRHCSGCS